MASIRNWVRSRADVEADELRRESKARDCEPICDCVAGQVVTVGGTVRSLSLHPRTKLPQLEIELYDGTGSVKVIWIGRRMIKGITAGRRMNVTGRLTFPTGEPTIFNPRYELKPVHG